MPLIIITKVVLIATAKKLGVLGTAGALAGVGSFVLNLIDFSKDFWKNSDAEEFEQRMRELENDLKEMERTMNDYCTCLENSAQDYDDTQDQSKARAGSLQSPTRI